MEDSSGRENGVLHGTTRNRSRPEAKVAGDEESRAPPAGTLRKDNVRNVSAKKKGAARWVMRRETAPLFVALSGNRGRPRRLERTAGTSCSKLFGSSHEAKTDK